MKITCIGLEVDQCQSQLTLTNPNLVSVLHIPNNHILIMKDDYDLKGAVKRASATDKVEADLDIEFRKTFRKIKEVEFR